MVSRYSPAVSALEDVILVRCSGTATCPCDGVVAGRCGCRRRCRRSSRPAPTPGRASPPLRVKVTPCSEGAKVRAVSHLRGGVLHAAARDADGCSRRPSTTRVLPLSAEGVQGISPVTVGSFAAGRRPLRSDAVGLDGLHDGVGEDSSPGCRRRCCRRRCRSWKPLRLTMTVTEADASAVGDDDGGGTRAHAGDDAAWR